jgi:hypothetical protein
MMSFSHTLAAATLLLTSAVAPSPSNIIPPAQGTALDGHAVTLPRDLATHATILIIGYSQHSADNTTAWEKPIRAQLASPPAIGYFDMPCIEDAPSFVRPLIVRSIRKQVPDPLKPFFVPLTSGQAAWKQLTGFTPTAPDAAYIVLVDGSGRVLWQTHEPYSPARFNELSAAARNLAARKP